MNSETQPTSMTTPSVANTILAERDALRDEVEGLKAGVDTVMRALKIALKEHNEARMREAVLIDLLRQSEAECDEARDLLRRCRAILPSGNGSAALLDEIDASLLMGDDTEEED